MSLVLQLVFRSKVVNKCGYGYNQNKNYYGGTVKLGLVRIGAQLGL